jgi:hypothetical protein
MAECILELSISFVGEEAVSELDRGAFNLFPATGPSLREIVWRKEGVRVQMEWRKVWRQSGWRGNFWRGSCSLHFRPVSVRA